MKRFLSILTVLRDRAYVRMDKNRFIPEDKGRLVTAFLEEFFKRYVEYDFTAALEEKLDLVSDGKLDWKQFLRDFWKDFHAAVGEIAELRVTNVLDALNVALGPHIFPAKEDGSPAIAVTADDIERHRRMQPMGEADADAILALERRAAKLPRRLARRRRHRPLATDVSCPTLTASVWLTPAATLVSRRSLPAEPNDAVLGALATEREPIATELDAVADA
eukprot:gene38469-biopygen25563